MVDKKDPRKPSQEEIQELNLGDDPVKHDFGDNKEKEPLLSEETKSNIAALVTIGFFVGLYALGVHLEIVGLGPLEGIIDDLIEMYELLRGAQEDGIFSGAPDGV